MNHKLPLTEEPIHSRSALGDRSVNDVQGWPADLDSLGRFIDRPPARIFRQRPLGAENTLQQV
jgi:hypothetical protein